jgi:hypothetical protein
MHSRLTTRTLAIAGILASTALVPTAANAAQPKDGLYVGKTTQDAAVMPFAGKIKLKVVKSGGYRVAKFGVRTKMNCQGDPARIETFRVAVPIGSGKVSGSGRFSYSASTSPTSGYSIKGRFVSRTKARGTFGLSDASSGCYTGTMKWSASLL